MPRSLPLKFSENSVHNSQLSFNLYPTCLIHLYSALWNQMLCVCECVCVCVCVYNVQCDAQNAEHHVSALLQSQFKFQSSVAHYRH
jgi:hypothetical protein